MTVTHSDVEHRLGITFSSSTKPTDTEIDNMITAAKNIIHATCGSVPDDSNTDEAELVIDVVVQLIKQYFRYKNYFSASVARVEENLSFIGEPVLTAEIKERMRLIYEHVEAVHLI